MCALSKQVYLGKELENDNYVTVEQYIPGEFVKYMNNTGAVCVEPATDEWVQKAECLAHFSYEKSSRKLVVVDIQGTNNMLYDPEIASAEQFENDELLFCTGNLSHQAIDFFVSNHQCNDYCKSLGLQDLN